MQFTGELVNVTTDWNTGKVQVTFTLNEKNELAALEGIKDTTLDIKAVKHREKRSRDANALLWACLGEIANVTGETNWERYLKALKDYGQFTYVVVKEKAVEAMKKAWRECQEVGEIEVNGQKAVQMICYFGSSTYDSKQFSRLLEGVVQDMRDLGLQPPPSKEMKQALERLEKDEKRITE